MTIEQKAKAYDEAIKRAKEVCVLPTDRATIEAIFPELKESEDERIRKDCIKYLDWEYQHCPLNEDKMKIEKCVAWLEKQGKQKPTECKEGSRQQEKLDYIEKHADKAMQSICKSFGKDTPNHLVTAGYRWGFDDGYKWYMNHPLGVLDEDYALAIYNFVNEWKSGKYGEIELQKAIKDNFKF